MKACSRIASDRHLPRVPVQRCSSTAVTPSWEESTTWSTQTLHPCLGLNTTQSKRIWVADSWFLLFATQHWLEQPSQLQNGALVFQSPAPPPALAAPRDTSGTPHSPQALDPRPSPKCCEGSGLPIQICSSCKSKYLQILSDCHSDSQRR